VDRLAVPGHPVGLVLGVELGQLLAILLLGLRGGGLPRGRGDEQGPQPDLPRRNHEGNDDQMPDQSLHESPPAASLPAPSANRTPLLPAPLSRPVFATPPRRTDPRAPASNKGKSAVLLQTLAIWRHREYHANRGLLRHKTLLFLNLQ